MKDLFRWTSFSAFSSFPGFDSEDLDLGGILSSFYRDLPKSYFNTI